MARRLQLTAISALLFVVPLAAQAEQYIACWVHKEWDPLFGRYLDITQCRLAGGEIVDFASDHDVPARLYPMLGTANGVVCWFYTSRPNAYWVIVFVYPGGEADIAYVSENGEPVPIGLFSRCSSEPEDIHPEAAVWEHVMSYIHPPPEPDLDPQPGLGVTGLETRLTVPVPDPHSAVLAESGMMLEVEIEVTDVIVHWGDGTITIHPATDFATDDSPAAHRYERKDPESRIAVAYVWHVRWRPAGGTWFTLDVPDTITTVAYPVNEIVSVLGS